MPLNDMDSQMETKTETRLDTQVIEIIGRNWLINDLVKAGLEVATPIRDHGIDLIVYADKDEQVRSFTACPIQMKAASKRSFAVSQKYGQFPNLLLAYIWYLGDPKLTRAYALTFDEAVSIAEALGWTCTQSWIVQGGYSTSNPNGKLISLLSPYAMTSERWRKRILQITEIQQ